QLSHLFRGKIHTRLNDHGRLRFHKQNHKTLAAMRGVGEMPIRGREYFRISALGAILNIVDDWIDTDWQMS
ncbi:hypothetical protein ACFRMN_34970, partial [Streptomyces sp. NPDC056835]|uniref:hypothetical protein n=1 Tax=Streptomyces sp. NPDC056835 TaxID=3345956 RepID=UPI00367E1F27